TDQTDNVAMVYTLDGKLVRQLGTRGQASDTGCEDWHNLPLRAAGPFNHPTELMPGPSGDLYVTDGYRNSRVHRFSKDGELIQSEMPHAHGMGIDSSGNIYVGRTKELRVDKYVRLH